MSGGAFVASVIVFIGLFGNNVEHRQVQQVLFDWLPGWLGRLGPVGPVGPLGARLVVRLTNSVLDPDFV